MPKRHSHKTNKATQATNKPYNNINRKAKIVRSCSACHSRKVACSQERPACQACLRHARTLGVDPSTVKCEYAIDNMDKDKRDMIKQPSPVELGSAKEEESEEENSEVENKGVDSEGGEQLKEEKNVGVKAKKPSSKGMYSYKPPSPPADPVFHGMGCGVDPRRSSLPRFDSYNISPLSSNPSSAEQSFLPTPEASPNVEFDTTPLYPEAPQQLQPAPLFTSLFANTDTFSLSSPPVVATTSWQELPDFSFGLAPSKGDLPRHHHHLPLLNTSCQLQQQQSYDSFSQPNDYGLVSDAAFWAAA